MSDNLKERIEEVTDRSLLARLGESARLGRGFFFVEAGALASSIPGWMQGMLRSDAAEKARIVPLFGSEPIELPGVTLAPTTWTDLQLQTVTSDRALYRESEDVVELLLYDPFQTGQKGFIEIQRNGVEFGRRVYESDEFGLATTALAGLPAGEYTVRFDDSPEHEPSCEFTVAAYRMAGLTASLRQHEIRDGRLHATLGLESYGAPFSGAVRIALLSGGTRVDGAQFDAKDGTAKVNLRADGDGPFDLEVQLVDDPTRTATVRIVGSRRSEREETPVAAIDRDLAASLMPTPGAREIRGMFVSEQGSRISLFKIADIETTAIELTAATRLSAATAVLFEPGSQPRTVHRDSVDAGETWQIDFGGWSSVALLAVAGITEDGRAWEGWTLVSAPSSFTPHLVIPDDPEAGTTVEIGVRVDSVDAGEAYFVVKDARLITPDTPSNRLAGAIKQWASDASDALGTGFVDRPLRDVLDHVHDTDEYAAVADGMNPSLGGPGGAPLEVMYARSAPPPQAGAAPPLRASAPAPAQMRGDGVAALETEGAMMDEIPSGGGSSGDDEGDAPSSQEEAQVYFVGTAPLHEGEATVEVELPDGFVDVHVDVFVANQKDWGGTSGDFHVERTPFLAPEYPRFVHRSDAAAARLVAFCESGRMRVTATLDGEDVELFDAEERLDGAIEAKRAELMFLARAGEVRATVEDLETGDSWEVTRQIDEPGKLRAVAKTLRFLEPEEIVTTEEQDVIGLRVLPGLDEPFELICDATADYGHACCEQTAAKMLSACAMFVFAGEDEERRSRARRIIDAGVRREESMFLPGRGFKMYPESSPTPDQYWGSKASNYLHYLGLVDTDELAFGDVLARGLEMAADAAAAYGIDFPPSKPASLEDAYAAVRFGDSAPAHEAALDLARSHADGDRPVVPTPPGFGGAVMQRMDDAFAAAVLLRAGGSSDLPVALTLANRVVSDLGPEGRLYSTADSVAAIGLMSELQSAGIVGGAGRVEIDGEEYSTDVAQTAAEPTRVRCLEGRVAVEIDTIVEEDWEALRPDADIRVSLASGGRKGNHFAPGDELELVVEIADGYQAGDVLWVCLPDALSRVEGGGQVKLFSVDFAEQSTVSIPLAATSVTLGEGGEITDQKYMVCLRNMFVEERAGNPGLLGVRVDPAGSPGVLQKLIGGLRRLLE